MLNSQEVKLFIDLYRSETGVDLTHEQAIAKAQSLITLVKTLIKEERRIKEND